MNENVYDQVPYTTLPRLVTHPDRLGAVGKLFGMSPAPVASCRVLEIGCGDASNLIPMAFTLPESRFTGVDLAAVPIATGRERGESLGLKNLRLEAADLRDIGESYGEFDYIFAHGVYSWVPAEVRDGLLAVCRARLAPEGIAFISYNALPGRHLRQMLREMLLYHTRQDTDTEQRLEHARELLGRMRESKRTGGWKPLLEAEIDAMFERPAGSLFHDDLADCNQSVYFHEFADHAARHGLQYLGEAEPHEMFDTTRSLDWVNGGVLEREQYGDFLKVRSFRQTLLCREERTLRRDPDPGAMDGFLFSAPSHPLEDGRIEGLRRIRITPVHDAVRGVAGALGDSYPLPLAFEELIPYAGEAAALREILYGLVIGGFADLHVHDFPCEEEVTAKPRASRLVRSQAELSPYVTSVCNHIVKLDEPGRRLVSLLDGTRSHEQLVRALAGGAGVPAREKLRAELVPSLEWMARMGLLEG